jgi:DNA polymerase-3 subunit chi
VSSEQNWTARLPKVPRLPLTAYRLRFSPPLTAYRFPNMTQIDFYTRVEDKLRTACRIATKGYGSGQRILVCCPDAETAGRLDRLLWTTPAIGFVPHCAADDPLAPVTPVVVDFNGTEPPHDEILLNLRPEWPQHFSRFRRLIEIVSLDDEDRRGARDRYRFYRDRGYDIRTHDLSKSAE